ncbi:MAG: hypothetical protein ACK4OM_00275 [Alphaproteobacteria bacterium]
MKNFNELEKGTMFPYNLNNTSKPAVIIIESKAKIDKLGNFEPARDIDENFVTAVQNLYQYLSSAEKSLPEELLVIKGKGLSGVPHILIDDNLEKFEREYTAKKNKNNFNEAYLKAFAGTAQKIIGEKFNAYAAEVYDKPQDYSYESILIQVGITCPKSKPKPVTRTNVISR